jgi:large conductance mechanosensitive channel
MGIVKEFRDFAVKGNAIDMAVGIIIGGAFGKVVTSIVNDLVMPPVGMLLAGKNFAALAMTLKEGYVDQAGKDVAPVMVKYGMFLSTMLDFIIMAFVIFLMVKLINRARSLGTSLTGRQAQPSSSA